MKEFSDQVQYLVHKSIRRGAVTIAEIATVSQEYGDSTADTLAEELHKAGVQFIQDPRECVTPQNNVLMNNLTLVELVSLCLQLPVVPKTPRRHHQHVLRRRSYELDLKRLDYLEDDYEWYYLSPSFNKLQRSIRNLFKTGEIPFARDWEEGDRRTNPNYLKGLTTHAAFANKILPKIRQHYLGLGEVQCLVTWIEATGELIPNMADIVRAGLKQDGTDVIRRVLFSDQPSTAESALKNRKDVCFTCPPQRRCRPLCDVADPYPILKQYRSSVFDVLVPLKYPGLLLADCLLQDGLLMKFFLPYSLVVASKGLMIEIGVLDVFSRVLPKNTGKYCPFEDRWFPAHREVHS